MLTYIDSFTMDKEFQVGDKVNASARTCVTSSQGAVCYVTPYLVGVKFKNFIEAFNKGDFANGSVNHCA